MNIKRIAVYLLALLVVSVFTPVFSAGVNEQIVAFDTISDVSFTSEIVKTYNVAYNGRHRVRAEVSTSEGEAYAYVYKNDKQVWQQFISDGEEGVFDVRMLANVGDNIKLKFAPQNGKIPKINYSYSITTYDGIIAVNDTTPISGIISGIEEGNSLHSYIKGAPANGVSIYAVYNDIVFPMSREASGRWSTDVLKNFSGGLGNSWVFVDKTIDGSDGFVSVGSRGGSPNIDVPISKDGVIRISGSIPGITPDEVYTNNVLTSVGYSGIESNVALNGKQLWSSRVGESSVRYDDEYEVSYFLEEMDIVARVKKGDVLTFAFNPWRKCFKTTASIPNYVDIKDIRLEYIDDAMSLSTKWELKNSIIFDLYSKEVYINGTPTNTDIVFEGGKPYLFANEAARVFGNTLDINDKIERNEKKYYNLEDVITNNDKAPITIDNRLIVAQNGIDGQISYAEQSQIMANIYDDVILSEEGKPVDFSDIGEKVRVNIKFDTDIEKNVSAKIILAGYNNNSLVYANICPHEIIKGDIAVNTVMNIDNTKQYDKLKVFVWNMKENTQNPVTQSGEITK